MMQMETYELIVETDSAAETQALGERVAGLLGPGAVLALAGDLGTGKTVFTQGLARGLGIRAAITSPTFILINRYRAPDGRILQHADCYRLANATLEMRDVGLTDLLESGDEIVVIEWADRITGLLTEERLEIIFTYLNDTRRRLHFIGHGARYAKIVRELT